MPWTAPSGRAYDLLYLDTNALSSVFKHPTTFGRSILEQFPPDNTAFCHSLYTLIEVRRRPDLWLSFVELFRTYPWFLLEPYRLLIQGEADKYHRAERHCPLVKAFTPIGDGGLRDVEAEIDDLFGPRGVADAERRWREDENEILEAWLANRDQFEPTQLVANAADARRYIEECHSVVLYGEVPAFVERELQQAGRIDMSRFPALQTMLLSLYYRLFDPTWKPLPQEVTDVRIAAVAPYVDAFVTERFQAEVLAKAKQQIPALEHCQVLRLRNVRGAAQDSV